MQVYNSANDSSSLKKVIVGRIHSAGPLTNLTALRLTTDTSFEYNLPHLLIRNSEVCVVKLSAVNL